MPFSKLAPAQFACTQQKPRSRPALTNARQKNNTGPNRTRAILYPAPTADIRDVRQGSNRPFMSVLLRYQTVKLPRPSFNRPTRAGVSRNCHSSYSSFRPRSGQSLRFKVQIPKVNGLGDLRPFGFLNLDIGLWTLDFRLASYTLVKFVQGKENLPKLPDACLPSRWIPYVDLQEARLWPTVLLWFRCSSSTA